MIKLQVTIGKELYYKNGFGIYGCKPKGENSSEVLLNSYNSFSIKGKMFQLVEGNDYTIEVDEKFEKFNDTYTYPLLKVHVPKNTSSSAQYNFLKTVTTEKQYKAMIEKFPPNSKLKIIDAIKDGSIDLTTAKGVGLKNVNAIKKKIVAREDFIHVYNRLSPLGVSENMVNKIINHYGSPQTVMNTINNSMYNLCAVKGLGFKTVDEYALNAGEKEDGFKRIEACINYLVYEYAQEGHSWTSIEEMKTTASKMLNIDEYHLDVFLGSLDLMDEDSNLICVNDNQITNKKYYTIEKELFDHLKRIDNSYINNIDVSTLNEYISLAEDKLGFDFTEEQLESIIESFKHGVYVINGKGGTGKSFLMKGITEICEGLGLVYQAVALSGRAAQLLTLKGINTSTIHRLLGFTGEGFEFNEETPLPHDVIILEEASMVNAQLWHSIVSAMKDGSKLIMVGDSGQLSAIGNGDVLRDILNNPYFNGKELTQIHRQAQDSGIIEVASKFRKGEQVMGYKQTIRNKYGANGDLIILTSNDKQEMYKEANQQIKLKMLKSDENDIMNFQILVSNKSRGEFSTVKINKYCQELYIDDEHKDIFIKNMTHEFFVGDKVIINGNKYKARLYQSIHEYESTKEALLEENGISGTITELYNGTIGIVRYIDTEKGFYSALIEFEGFEGYIRIDDSEISDLDLAYAITVHKCVTGDTFVYTNKGIMTIKESLNDKNNIKVFSGKNLIEPSKFHHYKNEDTLKVTTNRGFIVEGTYDHRLITMNSDGEFKHITLEELEIGTPVFIRKNGKVFGNKIELGDDFFDDSKLDVRAIKYKYPSIIDKKLSEYLGMVVADGSVYDTSVRYSKRYKECADRFIELVKDIFGYNKGIPRYREGYGDYLVGINSSFIKEFTSCFDGVQPNNKYVPSLILQTTEENQCAFLRGIFEDGTVNLKKDRFDHIELTMHGEKVIRQIQMMLLNLGIMSTVTKLKDKKCATRNQWALYIYRSDARIFERKIGFISKFKSDRLKLVNAEYKKPSSSNKRYFNLNKRLFEIVNENKIKLSMHQRATLRDKNTISDTLLKIMINKLKEHNVNDSFVEYLEMLVDGFEVDYIKTVEKSSNDVYCYTIPNENTFIQNGFYGMNCQGMSIENVFALLDYGAFKLLSRQQVYTAITRASKKCVLLAEHGSLWKAVSTDSSGSRRTFVGQLIRDESN